MKGLALDTNIAIDILNGKKEIAEICKSFDVTIATRDKHFNYIPDLKVKLFT